jgi:hypothetical protein
LRPKLFSFQAHEKNGSASIFINIPLAHHRDKKMCVQASVAQGAALGVGAELALAPCEPGNAMQAFNFFRAGSPPRNSEI